MHTNVTVDIEAPRAAVWKEAVDFASHAEWMSDANSIESSAIRTRLKSQPSAESVICSENESDACNMTAAVVIC